MRIVVEHRHQFEAPGSETLVGGNRFAEVTGPDQQDVGDAIGAKDAAQAMDERHHFVADARATKLPKIGQILANLCVGESERLGEFAAGNGRDPIGLERFELAQIEAEPADRGVGHLG